MFRVVSTLVWLCAALASASALNLQPYQITQVSALPHYGSTGMLLPGATVSIYKTGGTVLASLYNSSGAPISNPMTADQNGSVLFYADTGTAYYAVWSLGSFTSPQILLPENGGAGGPAFNPNAASYDLHTTPPSYGNYLGAQGSWFDICTRTACLPAGYFFAENYVANTSTRGSEIAEYTLTLDNVIQTGEIRQWAISTAYAVGQERIAAGTFYTGSIYRVTTAGTSAATGAGPTGTGTAIIDGTVVWTYVSPAAYAQGKVGIYNSTYAKPGAGYGWGGANNFVMSAGTYTGLDAAFVGFEFDFSNFSGNCAVGGGACYNVLISGNTTYPILGQLWITTGATACCAAHYGIMLGGSYIADTSAMEISTAAPVGLSFGVLFPTAYSTATIDDNSTGGQGIRFRGTKTFQDVSSTSASPAFLSDSGTHSTASVFLQATTTPTAIAIGSGYTTSQIQGPGWTVSPTGAIGATSLTVTGAVQTGKPVVASLGACNAPAATARESVSDATQTLTAGIGAVVVGGGTNTVPVFCDGTSWRIGG